MSNLPTIRLTFDSEDRKETDVYIKQLLKTSLGDIWAAFNSWFDQHVGYYSVL